MELSRSTNTLISKVLEANANTAVVIQSGTPVGMPWIDDVPAVVHAWYGGNETGNAIADVVFGDVNPAGKLPLTIPRRLQDNPAYLNFRSEAGRVLYGEDVFVGYRYYEKVDVRPLFPFGHGLSYSTFALQSLQLEEVDDTIKVALEISNTGSRAGAEVVQVYVAPRSASIGRPIKELKAFRKVYLETQEIKGISIDLDRMMAISYWDESRDKWCSEAGEYKVLVGTSSAETPLEASFRISKTTYWTGLGTSA